MVRRLPGRPIWLLTLVGLLALTFAIPAAAQTTTLVKGVVRDDKGAPVDGAKVTIEQQGGTGRKFETKTNGKGEYIQVGLPSGQYKLTAEKDKLQSQPGMLQVSATQPGQMDLVIGINAAAAGGVTKAKAAELKRLFDEGVAEANAGKHDEAIAKFQEALGITSACADCYDNIGFSYLQKKDYDKAEEAYKKSIELKADRSTPYNGLANVYNAQKKFDLAGEASAKAAQLASTGIGASGGGNADALYNQGVILFNGGKSADAKPLFEQAIAANPDHADAHYMLGMALAGENPSKARAEFEKYLELAPTGKNAELAKQFVSALPK